MKYLILEEGFKPTDAQLNDIGGKDVMKDNIVMSIEGYSKHEIESKKIKVEKLRYVIEFDEKAHLEPNWLRGKYVHFQLPGDEVHPDEWPPDVWPPKPVKPKPGPAPI